MDYRLLGKSGLQVSEIGLGCNQFGGRVDEKGTAAIIHKAVEVGINFIDTSNNYGRGLSEEYIGKALKGMRHQVVLTTKVGGPMGEGPNQGRTASRIHIMQQIESSLRKLQTDYLDLYQIHFPDSRTPIEETLMALDDLVHQGKVRYIGCSNFAAWQIVEATLTARMYNLNAFISNQPQYNLLDRSIEQEILPVCQAYGLGTIPFSPIAGGFLTGKYQKGQPIPEGVRGYNSPFFKDRVLTDRNYEMLSKLEAFATKRGKPLGAVAIAWLLANPAVSTVIVGATRPEQVAENATATDWRLTPEEKQELDKIAVWRES